MASCIRCNKGGAKRQCPALQGRICPACCATHQRRDIACPDTCGFLKPEDDRSGFDSALTKVLRFACKDETFPDRAAMQLAGSATNALGEWETPLVAGYMVYGFADRDGTRAVDRFLSRPPGPMKLVEQEALQALRETAWPSLFEVQEAEVDVGAHFVDLITGEKHFAHEKTATHSLKQFDVALCWMFEIRGRLELTGANALVPRVHLETVLRPMKREFSRLRKSSQEPDRVLLRQAVPAAHKALRKAVNEWRPPRMVTTDGEEMIFCEAIFATSNTDAVSAKLSSHPNFEQDEDRWVWLDRAGRAQLGDGPLVLGTVRLGEGQLVLETNSRERLERGKATLQGHLEELVTHRLDAVKDVEAAMQQAGDRSAAQSTEEVPPEIQAQVIGPLLQKHLESWIDESIPALGGKTPREAVKTAAGRKLSLLTQSDGSGVENGRDWRGTRLGLPPRF